MTETHSRTQGKRRYPYAIVFALTALILSLLAAPTSAMQLVKVGVYENMPKIFTSETGKPSGIFVDIIEEIAAREGWTIQYVRGNWSEGLDRLEKGEIDLMPDVALTSERREIFAFHNEPVLSDWSQIYAKRGSGIRSIVDLNGKRISILNRSIQQDAFKKLIDGFGLSVTLVPFPDYAAAFKAVSRGEAVDRKSVV